VPAGNGVEWQQPVPGDDVSVDDGTSDKDNGENPVAFVVPQDLMKTPRQGWPDFGLDDL